MNIGASSISHIDTPNDDYALTLNQIGFCISCQLRQRVGKGSGLAQRYASTRHVRCKVTLMSDNDLPSCYTIGPAAATTLLDMAAENLDFNQCVCPLFAALVSWSTLVRSETTFATLQSIWIHGSCLISGFVPHQEIRLCEVHTKCRWSVTGAMSNRHLTSSRV